MITPAITVLENGNVVDGFHVEVDGYSWHTTDIEEAKDFENVMKRELATKYAEFPE